MYRRDWYIEQEVIIILKAESLLKEFLENLAGTIEIPYPHQAILITVVDCIVQYYNKNTKFVHLLGDDV